MGIRWDLVDEGVPCLLHIYFGRRSSDARVPTVETMAQTGSRACATRMAAIFNRFALRIQLSGALVPVLFLTPRRR